MALGSAPAGVVRLVVWETLVWSESVSCRYRDESLSGQFIASLLYGVTPRDRSSSPAPPLMLVLAPSGVWPAYRASVTDPAIVLRHT